MPLPEAGRIHEYTVTYTYVHVFVHIHRYMHTCSHTCIHGYIQTFKHAIYTRLHPSMHHIFINSYLHAFTTTFMHTYEMHHTCTHSRSHRRTLPSGAVRSYARKETRRGVNSVSRILQYTFSPSIPLTQYPTFRSDPAGTRTDSNLPVSRQFPSCPPLL